ncbi:MAG: mltD [Steroidobacteraceae bacterium]|nr:mltD [Steroidobacteraceae bacterium]
MNLASALSAYTALNVAVVVAVLGLLAVESLRRHASALKLLGFHYWIAGGLAVTALVAAVLPAPQLFEPSASIWSAQEFAGFSPPALEPVSGYMSFGAGATNLDAGSVSRAWIATVLMLLAAGSFRLSRDALALRRIRRQSHCIRRHGRVRIWLNDTVRTPFSYWIPGSAHVVLPSYLLERGDHLRMVLAHELQHHRQRDTVWLYFFRALGWLCALNPFAHLWKRRLGRMQEFACDEALITRRGWSADVYARCLLDVAAREREAAPGFRLSTPLIRFGDPLVLTRRIEMMMQPKRLTFIKPLQMSIVAALLALMTLAAYAAGGWVQDRRVTREQAEAMAERVSANSGFTVVVNDEVLHELNRYAGTPEGREFMRASLQRFEGYRSEVVASLAKHGVPAELAAVPLVESGYQNLDASHNRLSSAGIWQFIPNTALAFGLRVDGQVDDRLDAERLTDAAGRMLRADHLRFTDWQLALMAFNMGAHGLQKAIDTTGSRDPWTLIRAGHEGDRGYLARVHAAVLIAANPGSVAP